MLKKVGRKYIQLDTYEKDDHDNPEIIVSRFNLMR